MKKVALTLASIAAFATFAPEASAIPAFARQVGMACSACHYQHFPVINAFGRAFKAAGYTTIGAQEKIEADGGMLSIPAVENLAIVGYVQYAKTNGAATPTGTAMSSNDGSIQIPQQVSLFAGGRGGEHFGYEAEINLTASPAGTGAPAAGLIRFKLPFVTDIGSLKAEAIPFSTPLGAADSYEVLNTGAVAVHAFNQTPNGIAVISAAQYIGTSQLANGLALTATGDNFFANAAKFAANNGDGTGGGLTSTYGRAAWTGDLSGFDSAIGVQSWSGTSYTSTAATPATGLVDTKAFAIDAQTMGDVAGMPLLVIASYATAPASPTTGNANLFNSQTLDKTSINIGAELGLIPNVATVQVGYRMAKNGVDDGKAVGNPASGTSQTDNAFLVGATYALALNMRFELTYTQASGTAWSSVGNVGNQTFVADIAFGL